MSVGGVAVFPSDTVYGLACDAANELAVRRLYALKRRPLSKPSAVMFFDLELALAALPELGSRGRAAFDRLLPGAVTVLVANPSGRFPLACGEDPSTLGARVPVVPSLEGVRWPVLQSSANLAGDPEARELSEVPEPIRRAADMVIDGGRLPGVASTIIDLRSYDADGSWRIVRQGAVPEADVRSALEWQFHFDPASYADEVREDIPVYDEFQDQVMEACGDGFARVLELGSGTGETAARLLARNPGVKLVGIDESDAMLEVARARFGSGASFEVARLQDPLPDGPFDLVASALCVHHLDPGEKRSLFSRVARVLRPGGRFVLGDVVVPVDPADAVTPLTPGFDKPSTLDEQLAWLGEAGFEPRVTWQHRDLAVVCCAAGVAATIGAP
jgi:tRNA threonylcarbamoyl adenosine modification protein (Sua5/YciO/YrdC/YwlC family)